VHQLVIKEGSVLLMHGVTMKYNAPKFSTIDTIVTMVTCHLISEMELPTSLTPASLSLLLLIEGNQKIPAWGHCNIQELYFTCI